jgi:hypothetical protein
VSERGLKGKTPTERKLARREAFDAAEASPYAPRRLRLGKLLIDLDARGDEVGRAALLDVFARGTFKWGVWKAAKHIYKLAEARHDAAMFGVLAYRFDTLGGGDVGVGTRIYLRRRAWRYLRLLGRGTPDAYPVFAVEVLRHYPASVTEDSSSWVAAHIFCYQPRMPSTELALSEGDELLEARAFPAAWKVSPAPLLRLLEVAQADVVCEFAIRCLRGDHPLALRSVEPAWIARLGERPLPAIHAFVVQLLKDSPDLHQSKLKAAGLHDMVIGLLRSQASEARAYALEYAAAHAPDLAVDLLVELVEGGHDEVKKFAAARLEGLAPADIGLARLLRLLARTTWAAGKIDQGFAPAQITAAMFADTALIGDQHFVALLDIYNRRQAAIPASYWTALLDDPRCDPSNWSMRKQIQTAMQELGKRSARDIGVAWIQAALEDRRRTDTVARWLDAGMLSGDDLDVDWLKRLVAKPRLRAIALRLLGDRRRVAPARVGMAWLLELARSPESDLATFAQRMLLESFEPADLGGVPRLWELATGKVEAVRAFAATYLKAHHPELGPRMPEAKALGIKPRLTAAAYALATVRPLFDDDRADVRRFAAAIGGEELERWNEPELVYALAASPHKEARALGSEWLLGLVTDGATKKIPVPWLDGGRLFQLAESPHKPARETALTLIRRLYDQVGSAERLAWLMDSPDRDVRLFAVRLFWDRHRPKPDFTPRKNINAPKGNERFHDVPAVRQFLRVVLFGLPPGRMPVRDPVAPGAPQPERPLAASVAKRRLIEVLRDVALDDADLARAIEPVLGEFTSSTAKGEWQASVQALTALRARHGA